MHVSETGKVLDDRIAVNHKCSQFLSISLLNHVQTAGYMGHVFGSGFDGKHVDFDSTVSAIYRGLSQAESFCRRVGAPDYRTSINTLLFTAFLS
ncbi:hypothetical protein TNCT_211271 [Trichonephila clavata]|uniref:Uncharacterized protein n=1 Tax=Trichonephila clavata TaxID=2740835 RepID=A0A8X6F9L9_TRICU|nr:hypothetical protein TNCT_211271 [Trichonephila clavata]